MAVVDAGAVNQVAILDNDGACGAQRSRSTLVGGGNVSIGSLVAGDFDGMGGIDLAYAADVGPVRVLSGALVTLASVIQPDGSFSVHTADFTGDGLTDVAVSNDRLRVVTIIRNSPTGFTAITGGTIPVEPRMATSTDVDGDGDVDLVIASSLGSVAVLLNNGSGNLAESRLTAQPEAVVDRREMTAADMDGDGDMDIVILDLKQVRILINQ